MSSNKAKSSGRPKSKAAGAALTLPTMAAVAEMWDVSSTTVKEWKSRWLAEGFAWASGPYPIAAIIRWKEERDKKLGETSRARREAISAEREAWEFAKLKGQFVQVDVPGKIMGRAVATAVRILDQASKRVASILPDEIDPEAWPQLKHSIQTSVRETHEDAISQMGSGLRELEAEIGRLA